MFKHRWRSAILFALMLVGGMILSPARSAFAHAEPDITIPAADNAVDQAPPQVEITFTEEVTAETTIEVVGAVGKTVNSAPAALDLEDPNRKHVTVALFGALPAGVYTVNWNSVSAEDGDPDSGSYTFTVSSGVATPVASPMASPESTPMAMAGTTSDEGPKAEMNAAAEAAQQAATDQAATEDNFDGSSYLISVLAGVAGAIVIYFFWRHVRPKPHERFVVQ